MSRRQGFTLLELLVVMALLSLLMVGTLSALRGTAQVEVRVDRRLEQADELRLLPGFLSQAFSAAWQVKRSQTGADEIPFWLESADDHLAWVGAMPARPGLGGLYFFQLAWAPDAQGRGPLLLRYEPFDGQTRWPDWEAAAHLVLQQDVTQFQLQFEDIRSPQGWVPNWTDRDNLPSRVSLQLAVGEEAWPPLRLSWAGVNGRPDGLFGVGGSE